MRCRLSGLVPRSCRSLNVAFPLASVFWEIMAGAGVSTPTSAPTRAVPAESITVTTKVTLGTIGQGYGLAVELEASLPELPRDQAEALVAAAHQVCPYSNATRGNIDVTLNIV